MLTPDLSVIEGHARPVLQFSGGKDSLACLWLLKPYWPKLTLAFLNTGDAFPETLKIISRARWLTGEFLEIKSDQPAQIARAGYPADVLPVRRQIGMKPLLRDPVAQPLQSFMACCWENLMLPMHEAMQRIGATLIIRGTRGAEAHTTPLRSGEVVEGVEYLFPVFDWSADEVKAYLADKPIGLPEHYDYVDSSLDCRLCTAYLSENLGKLRYMSERHPDARREVSRRLEVIEKAASAEVEMLKSARSAGAAVITSEE